MKTSSLTLIPMKLLFMMIKIPNWITTKIKDLIQKRSSVYKYYDKRSKSIQLFQIVQYFQNFLTAIIEVNKQKYFRMDPRTSSEKRWSLLKALLNSKKYRVFHNFIITKIYCWV